MKNIFQGFVGAAIVVAIAVYGWVQYQTRQETSSAAAFARRGDALVVQQLSMLDDPATRVADYFSATAKATDDLSSCIVDIDSAEWKYAIDAKDALRTLCSTAKAAISTIAGSTRLRLARKSAADRADKASAAISQSKSSYEIERLRVEMSDAYDEQIKTIEKEMADLNANAESVKALLTADERAVSVLKTAGLEQAERKKLSGMYPDQ